MLFDSLLFSIFFLSHIHARTVSQDSENWEIVGSSYIDAKYLKPLIYEGLTNNGQDFIMNSKNNIFIMNSNDYTISMSTWNAIPKELQEDGYNHLGDATFFNNQLYIAVEEPSYTKPSIFVYDIATDSFIFNKHQPQQVQAHMPWVAIDTDKSVSCSDNYIYSSEFDNVDHLFMYNITTLQYERKLQLSTTLDKVQGGAIYKSYLYLGTNVGDTVYKVNLSTGLVTVAMQQYEPDTRGEYEFEGITFLDLKTSSGLGVMHNTGNNWENPKEMGKITHCDVV